MTTQAIILREHGDASTLRLESASLPSLQPGELRVRNSVIGVNFHDAYVRSGLYKTLSLPGTPGLEAVGEVVETGPGTAPYSVGDRVAYVDSAYGAYATEKVVRANLCVTLPEGLPDRTAGAMFLKGLTAAALLHHARPVRQGDAILVHAAAGGVGRLLVQWGKHLGATVIGTVGSPEKAEVARILGCDEVILYREEDFAERALQLTQGRGVDAVYDAVGRDTFDGSLKSLAVLGHLLNYGQASGPVAPFDIGRLAQKGLTLSRPAYAHHVRTPEALRAVAGMVFDAIQQGILQPEAGTAFALAEAAKAHEAMESRSEGPFVLIP